VHGGAERGKDCRDCCSRSREAGARQFGEPGKHKTNQAENPNRGNGHCYRSSAEAVELPPGRCCYELGKVMVTICPVAFVWWQTGSQ